MQIGAIGTTSFNPYIYNTNHVTSASLNKISSIPEDATKRKVDYSGLLSEEENINPLGKGRTSNFMDILASQMAMSGRNSAMLMKTAQEVTPATSDEADLAVTAKSEEAVIPNVQAAEADVNQEATFAQNTNQFRMMQAINAYNMNMGIA